MAECALHHAHSHFSSLDGWSTIDELIERTIELGYPSVTVTDHGNVGSHLELQGKCDKAGLKSIFGIEAYHGILSEYKGQQRDQAHLIVGAYTDEGLKNLWRLSDKSASYFRFVPRVDWGMLEEFREGLWATSACIQGLVSQGIKEGDSDCLNQYLDIFGENFFIEIHTYPTEDQKVINQALVQIAREKGLPLLWSSDAHYPSPREFKLHDVYLCLQMGDKVDTPIEERKMWHPEALYIKSEEEVRADLAYLGESVVDECIRNSFDLSEKCTARLPEIRRHLPVFIPSESKLVDPEYKALSSEDLLTALVVEGAYERYDEPSEAVWDRLRMELDVLIGAHLEDYILQVWEIGKFCDTRGILRGPGRGCLKGDVPIYTNRGFIPISQVVSGDRIITHKGSSAQVLHRWEYECDEDLIQISSYYDGTPVTVTKDHKIWCQKGQRTPESYWKSRDKRRIWETPTGEGHWVRAEDIQVGDLVAKPRINLFRDAVPKFDLAKYAQNTSSRKYFVLEDKIVEFTKTNKPYEFSTKNVSKIFGITRNTIMNILNEKSTVKPQTIRKFRQLLAAIGFSSISAYKEYYYNNAYVQRRYPRYIEVDMNFCLLLGRYVADGWISSKGYIFGVADRGDISQDIPRLFYQVFRNNLSRHNHATKNLTQWTISSPLVRDFIHEIMPGYEFIPETKELPDWALNLNRDLQWQIIRGAWAGDGSHSGKDTYTSTSYKLIGQIRTILWNLGVVNGFTCEHRKDSRKEFANTQPSYIILAARDFAKPKSQFGWADDEYLWMRVNKVELVTGCSSVYDLAIDHEDHSFLTDSWAVHNSSAGSLVCYCLRITDIDALKYGLYFERFYNAGREKGLPDIDIDFSVSAREKVKEFVANRWGHDKVENIGTVMRLKPIAALNKTWACFGVTGDEFSTIRKIVGKTPDIDILGADSIGWKDDGGNKSIYVWESVGAEIEEYIEGRPQDRQEIIWRWLDFVGKLVGRVSGYGIHPSGVVVSDTPINEELPRMWSASSKAFATQFPMDDVAKRMFLKDDLLGIRNLDTLEDWQQQMRAEGVHVDWSGLEDLDQQPEEMWEMLEHGLGVGIFQIEDKSFPLELCKRMRPRNIEDLALIVALNRPGPQRAGSHERYIARRNGEAPLVYDDPFLEDILESTRGEFIYQESVIALFSKLGYSLSEADEVRSLLGKKNPEEQKRLYEGKGQWRDRGYLSMAKRAGLNNAQIVWDKIEGFSKYSFNLSHACVYGVIAFRTLFAKYWGPKEFILACIRTNPDDMDKYIGEGRRLGIEVKVPHIAKSDVSIGIVEKEIYLGFSEIKGLSKSSSKYILFLRDKYRDKVYTPDGLEKCLSLENEIWANKAPSERFRISPRTQLKSNQVELLKDIGAFDDYFERSVTDSQKRATEKQLLGIAITSNTKKIFERNKDRVSACDPYSALDEHGKATIAGMISDVRITQTKNGEEMAIVTIEHGSDNLRFACFPRNWRAYKYLLSESNCAILKITKNERGYSMLEGSKLS